MEPIAPNTATEQHRRADSNPLRTMSSPRRAIGGLEPRRSGVCTQRAAVSTSTEAQRDLVAAATESVLVCGVLDEHVIVDAELVQDVLEAATYVPRDETHEQTVRALEGVPLARPLVRCEDRLAVAVL